MNTTLASWRHSRPGIAALFIAALGTGLVLTMSAVARAQGLETQTFNSEASAIAAGWTEFGSRDNPFDYGFSNTNNAEGASAGEAGGTFARGNDQPAYYADLTLLGSSDLGLDLNATGRIKWQDANFDGEMYFGWFNRAEAEANVRDYIGLRFAEPRNGLWRVFASIDGNNGNQLNVPNNTALNFEIDWDADGGPVAGEGLLTLTLSTLDGLQTFVSTETDTNPMTWDAFGLLSNSQAGADSGNLWIDDLSYTVLIPEPSALVLAALGLLGSLSYVRRRRGR